MSGFLFLENLNYGCNGLAKRKRRHSTIKTISLLAAFFAVSTISSIQANPLDWFKSKGRTQPRKETQKVLAENAVLNLSEVSNALQTEQNITGQNLDPMSFAKSHWSHSKDKLEKVCKAIIQKKADKNNADILTKLFVIDTQVFKEAIKNSAMSVNELSAANETMQRQLADLTRIITAPGQETLESLEKNISALKSSNSRQIISVKKYTEGAERLIDIGSKAYETLELIPSLNTETDLVIASSKQLMKVTQSNSEAFKGLMLNVQASCEQFDSGLDTITRTVKETLRFSDHFAIKQFPLINLPAPSREKIYLQLNNLGNSLKGVGNTLSIADSQVRNTSQQFTHLVSALMAKVGESLKFSAETANNSDQAIAQISNYARNQVAGLFQRVKEDIGSMKNAMALVVKNGNAIAAPAVQVESRDDYVARRTASVTSDKLPLFLLGASAGAAKAELVKPETANREKIVKLEKTQPTVEKILYSEKTGQIPEASDLMQTEMNILSEELGQNFFFADLADAKEPDNNETFADDSEEITVNDDDAYEDNVKVSYDNLNSIAEPEIELLRFDGGESEQESAELLPMMRMEQDPLMFDE
ncbi:MAG: hypothetical protein Kow0029_29020 [Candidatus Rifleibacteriota bacterium]